MIQSPLPLEITCAVIMHLPVSEKFNCRGISKLFYKFINELPIQSGLKSLSLKEHVQLFKNVFPSFIRSVFTVQDFLEFNFKNIYIDHSESIECLQKTNPILEECRGTMAIGELYSSLDAREYFFTFPCKEEIGSSSQTITFIFTGLLVEQQTFWHHSVSNCSKPSAFSPLHPNIELLTETRRYPQYEQFLKKIFIENSSCQGYSMSSLRQVTTYTIKPM